MPARQPALHPARPAGERGAALLAVLALVLLLASFATIGLARLRAAGDRVADADALFQADLLARSGAEAGRALVLGWEEGRRRAGNAGSAGGAGGAGNGGAYALHLATGTAMLRFEDGGNCFNLNSIARPPAPGAADGTAPGNDFESSFGNSNRESADFRQLLEGAGIPRADATRLAQRTAVRARAGVLFADASEWARAVGANEAQWRLLRPLLCALPSREAAAINLNALGPQQAPLLVAGGLSPDEARRILAARPARGWDSPSAFWQQASRGAIPQTALARVASTSSRWVVLEITTSAAGLRTRRKLLLDTAQQPARIASSRFLGAAPAPIAEQAPGNEGAPA